VHKLDVATIEAAAKGASSSGWYRFHRCAAGRYGGPLQRSPPIARIPRHDDD
jgi:hypothetical protein